MKILLRGYYGWGNFGDDVLLKVTHSLVRKYWKNAQIFVNSDAPHNEYIKTLLEDDSVVIVSSETGRCFDLIVHGGGGVFFDFNKGSLLNRIANSFVKSGRGFLYCLVDGFVRRLINKQRDLTVARIGWGVGVGTYSAGSRKLPHHLPILRNFNGVMVRDEQSKRNLDSMNLDVSVSLGSDIAFLSDYWMDRQPNNRINNGLRVLPKLGVLLRHWPNDADDNYIQLIVKNIEIFEKYFSVRYFILDLDADDSVRKLIGKRPVVEWNPQHMRLSEFAAELAVEDVLVTSRAHGAICGAVVGVPSVLLEIEPKLRTIHEMLPRATRLVSKNFQPEQLLEQINDLISCDSEIIMHEVDMNRSLAQIGVDNLIVVAQSKLND